MCTSQHWEPPTLSSPAVSLRVQGLWHPARKVRQVYWRLYNNLYIGAQDALVACYPGLQDDGINTYRRHELDVFI
jgi:splicing factor 3B subunit 1